MSRLVILSQIKGASVSIYIYGHLAPLIAIPLYLSKYSVRQDDHRWTSCPPSCVEMSPYIVHEGGQVVALVCPVTTHRRVLIGCMVKAAKEATSEPRWTFLSWPTTFVSFPGKED